MLEENVVVDILAKYGLTIHDVNYFFGSVTEKPKAEQDWIYLIHHMHQPEKESEMETLHHCDLFENKSMKGKKYKQKHVKDKRVFQHVLDLKIVEETPKVVYDHLNNGFKVKVDEIDGKKYAILNGLVSVKTTKWSDIDR